MVKRLVLAIHMKKILRWQKTLLRKDNREKIMSIICDRCKKEINPRKDKYFTIKSYEHNDPISISKLSEYNKLDLCKGCFSGTIEFITIGGKCTKNEKKSRKYGN
jgi:hypothetical protein